MVFFVFMQRNCLKESSGLRALATIEDTQNPEDIQSSVHVYIADRCSTVTVKCFIGVRGSLLTPPGPLLMLQSNEFRFNFSAAHALWFFSITSRLVCFMIIRRAERNKKLGRNWNTPGTKLSPGKTTQCMWTLMWQECNLFGLTVVWI